MASGKEYLRFVLDQLSDVDGITSRPMMGESLLYVRGRLFGGIYDDRLLVKPVPAALALTERAGRAAVYERPYEGAKEMLLIEDMDDREFLSELVEAMAEELPLPKPKKNRKEQRSPEPKKIEKNNEE